jgi:transcriptional regulator with XRE-family HTH domain
MNDFERIRIEPEQKQLTQKELAYELGKSTAYIKFMRRAGFRMEFHPIIRRRTASLQEAEDWLRANPDFRCHHYM